MGVDWPPVFLEFEALKPLQVPPKISSKNGDSPYILLVVFPNPSEKYARQIGSFPQVGGEN